MNEAHLGLAVASWLICQQRVVYVSSGRMMVSGRINLQEGAVFSEELANFFGTQTELMKSSEVRAGDEPSRGAPAAAYSGHTFRVAAASNFDFCLVDDQFGTRIRSKAVGRNHGRIHCNEEMPFRGQDTRILEKQNRLQMSQVLFCCLRITHQVVLLLKDSKARPMNPTGATPSAIALPHTLAGLRRGFASVRRGFPMKLSALKAFRIFLAFGLMAPLWDALPTPVQLLIS